MATSAASTFGNSWNRRLSDNTECFAHQPLYQGMRSPPSVATLDLPQGKVLVVVEDASIARERKVVDANRWPTAGMVVPWERVYPPI